MREFELYIFCVLGVILCDLCGLSFNHEEHEENTTQGSQGKNNMNAFKQAHKQKIISSTHLFVPVMPLLFLTDHQAVV